MAERKEKTLEQLKEDRMSDGGMVIIDGIVEYDGESESLGRPSRVGQRIETPKFTE